MKISFLYIKDYKNILNQKFDFDDEFTFDFNVKKCSLKLSSIHSVKNYFPKNISVNAIVGKNGSGKTNLLNSICELFNHDEGSNKLKGSFALFRHQKDFILFTHKSIKKKIELRLNNKKISFKRYQFHELSKAGASVIHYSNVSTNSTFYIGKKVSLLSDSYLGMCDSNDCDVQTNLPAYEGNQLNETLRQLSFFSNNDKFNLDITYPKKLNFDSLSTCENLIYGYQENLYWTRELFKERHFYKRAHQDKQYTFLLGIYLSFLQDIVFTFDWSNSCEPSKFQEFDNYFKVIDGNKTKSFIYKRLRSYSAKKLRKDLPFSIEDLEGKTELLISSLKLKLKVYDLFVKKVNNFSHSIKNQADKKFIKKLLRLYKESIYKHGYLSTNWEGFSKGEISKLNFYSRLFERIYNKAGTLSSDQKLTDPSLILLIDEGGTFFHPEWQISYVFDLIEFVKSIFVNNNDVPTKSVQIMLTTHSPFILSDLLREHITYLDKNIIGGNSLCSVLPDKEKPTSFAGNVNILFRNSFFLESSLMGKYANEITNSIIESTNKGIENSRFSKEDINLIIDELNEPVIQNHLKLKLK